MCDFRYSHAFDFGFEVKTNHPSDEVTAQELRSALLERINRISDQELLEACDCFDSTTWLRGDQDTPFAEHLLSQPADPAPIEILRLVTIEEQEAWLTAHGFFVGERNPRANTAFAGRFMVIETDTKSILDKTEFTFADAAQLDGGWCVVGDDRDELIRDTYAFFYNGDDE